MLVRAEGDFQIVMLYVDGVIQQTVELLLLWQSSDEELCRSQLQGWLAGKCATGHRRRSLSEMGEVGNKQSTRLENKCRRGTNIGFEWAVNLRLIVGDEECPYLTYDGKMEMEPGFCLALPCGELGKIPSGITECANNSYWAISRQNNRSWRQHISSCNMIERRNAIVLYVM